MLQPSLRPRQLLLSPIWDYESYYNQYDYDIYYDHCDYKLDEETTQLQLLLRFWFRIRLILTFAMIVYQSVLIGIKYQNANKIEIQITFFYISKRFPYALHVIVATEFISCYSWGVRRFLSDVAFGSCSGVYAIVRE